MSQAPVIEERSRHHTFPARPLHMSRLILLPASRLTSLPMWQHHASRLPSGGLLIVVPGDNAQMYQVAERICRTAQTLGRSTQLAAGDSQGEVFPAAVPRHP
jgi:hypothetical protein